MAVSRTAAPQERILPGSVEETFKRWCVQILGMILFIAALLGWACLASWSINDPSLNNATTGTPSNLLGASGAGLADILFQTVGLASIFVFLPLATWGWYCMTYTFPAAIFLRLLTWPLAVILLAGILSAFPKVGTWPLPLGLGGILGDGLLLKLPQVFSVVHIHFGKEFASFILAMFAIPTLLFTLALRLRDFAVLFNVENIGIKSLLLGMIGGFIRINFEIRNFFIEIIQRYHYERNARKKAMLRTHHFGLAKATEYGDETSHKRFSLTENWQPPRICDDYPQFSNEDRFDDEFANDNSMHEDALEGQDLAFDPDDRMIDYAGETLPANRRAQAAAEPAAQGGLSFAAFPFTRRSKQKALKTDYETEYVKKHVAAIKRFALPTPRLLKKPQPVKNGVHLTKEMLLKNAQLLQEVLSDFGILGDIDNIHAGPVVTLYEFVPARGTKSARVISLANDIARSMSAISARVAVVPGRNAIGIELPNETRETVYLRELFETKDFIQSSADLPLALGDTISGDPVILDLARMPHLLIAGTTGSGKSVGINAMILSLLFRLPPDKCKFIMIDPKMLELSVYDGIPHLLSPVVTDPKKAVAALKWTVQEMEERYKKMSKLNVRNITGYNERVKTAQHTGETLGRTIQTGFDRETGQAIYEHEEIELEPMPYIVVVIDEMADLMMVAGKDIEATVQRLAQMARAAGIHLIMATQRPSVDVITGTIKANFPSRISYQVSSKIDSRTILGEQGAEQLLGAGDMLYLAAAGRIVRAHGPFVTDEEIENVVEMLKAQGVPEYIAEVTEDKDEEAETEQNNPEDKEATLYDKAVDIILRDRKVSISYVQRRLSIGYNKAATLIEKMEEEGLITPPNRSGKREILVN